MTTLLIPSSAGVAALCLLASSYAAASPAAGNEADAVTRGGYLVRGFGCADCHTPLKTGPHGPEPDTARGLSGHPQALALPTAPAAKGPWIWGGAASNTAFYGPWGVSYAANLTPDPQHGIGSWTEAQFVAALKTGKHAGSGRPIAPPMPWQALSTLSEGDLRAIYAYLRAQPAVPNAVPAYAPPH